MDTHQIYDGAVHHNSSEGIMDTHRIDKRNHRFPHSIVWTPIPCLTWLFPIVGHMGIATSSGVIRDFAGSYYVSDDNMGFGWPTRYFQMDLNKVVGGAQVWDKAVFDASEEYNTRMHNLFCDNCHSHVAMALNQMRYGGSSSWNMFTLTFLIIFRGRSVSIGGWLSQWLPFLCICLIVLIVLVIVPVINA